MKLSAAFEASIALSFGDVSDAYQFFPSTLGISDNPDYRANLQHCRITDIDYKRNHAGVSDHVPCRGEDADFCTAGRTGATKGATPASLSICRTTASASSVRPTRSNQRGDSGR